MSQWYYAHDGKQSGPVPISELQRLAGNGDFDPEKDLVWQEGLPDWKPASTVPELSSLLPGATPEPTVEGGTPPPSPYQSPSSSAAHPAPAYTSTTNTPPSSSLAIASLICGLVGFLTCFVWCLSIPLAIAAIITGHMASAKIAKEPSRFTGKGLARTGLITGYLGLLLTIIYTAAIMYIATRTPEQMQEMEWLPAEFTERFTEELERQKAKQEN